MVSSRLLSTTDRGAHSSRNGSRVGACPQLGNIEDALSAAERLLVQAAEEARHAQNVQFAALSLLLLSLVSIAGVVIAIIESANPAAVLTIASLFAIGAPASVYLFQVARKVGRRRDSPNLRIAIEIAAMISDVFLDVAHKESWSVIRRESVRLRLSAFPLGRHGARIEDIAAGAVQKAK